MNYLLDSDAISALIKPAKPAYFDILSFLSQASNPALKLSILTIYEFEFNIARRPEEEKAGLRSLLNQTFDAFEEIPLGRKDAQIYGELKSGFLKQTGISTNALKRHNMDIALASVAIANDFILVSRDKIYATHLQSINPSLQQITW